MTHSPMIHSMEKGPYNVGYPGKLHYASCWCGWNSDPHPDPMRAVADAADHRRNVA